MRAVPSISLCVLVALFLGQAADRVAAMDPRNLHRAPDPFAASVQPGTLVREGAAFTGPNVPSEWRLAASPVVKSPSTSAAWIPQPPQPTPGNPYSATTFPQWTSGDLNAHLLGRAWDGRTVAYPTHSPSVASLYRQRIMPTSPFGAVATASVRPGPRSFDPRLWPEYADARQLGWPAAYQRPVAGHGAWAR
jgi:hypothetical protein